MNRTEIRIKDQHDRGKDYPSEAVVQSCSVKKVFLEISQNSQENTCARDSFLIKLQTLLKKESLAQVFSCEFWKISKNNFFTEHIRTTAAKNSLKNDRFDKSSMNNILYFVTNYLKRTFEKRHLKSGPPKMVLV